MRLRSTLPLLILLSLSAPSCRERVALSLPGPGWGRLDLTAETPQVTRGMTAGTVDVALSATAGSGASPAPPSRVRALSLTAGAEASWIVRVPHEAYFSFIPLRAGTEGCRLHYRVRVDPAGLARSREMPVTSPPLRGREAPAAVTFDLADWSGRDVELSIRAEAAGAGCDGGISEIPLWGSPAIWGRSPALTVTDTTTRPNVILVSFDAMRADAIGPANHRPSLTRAIDRLAAEGDVWTSAYSSFNVTNPSFSSIMTGLDGRHHNVLDLRTALPGAFNTLAEILGRAGYHTSAVVSAQHLCNGQSGLGQGFDDYVVAPVRFSAETAADLAMDQIATSDRPFFLWLHFFDPHTPHDAPMPWAEGYMPATLTGMAPVRSWTQFRTPGRVEYRDATLRAHEDLYDAEVAYIDRQIDRLTRFLESKGLLEQSVIVLVSDHGENGLDDRVPFRHVGLWDATTHVPLIIRRPGAAQAVHDELVQTLDLFPTILELAGVEVPPSDGRSLYDSEEARTELFARHSNGGGAMVRDRRYLYSTVHGSPFIADGEFLFDVRNDPSQRTNLATARRDIVAAYRQRLRTWLGSEP